MSELNGLTTELVNTTCYNTEDLEAVWNAALSAAEIQARVLGERFEGWGRSDRVKYDWTITSTVHGVIPMRLTFAYYIPRWKNESKAFVEVNSRSWLSRLDTDLAVGLMPVYKVYECDDQLVRLSKSFEDRPKELHSEAVQELAFSLLRLILVPRGRWRTRSFPPEARAALQRMPLHKYRIRIERAAKRGSRAKAKAARQRILAHHAHRELVYQQKRLRRMQEKVAFLKERRDWSLAKALELDADRNDLPWMKGVLSGS